MKDKLEQYKQNLMEKLKVAGDSFYEVNNFLRNPLNKNREIKRNLLEKAVDAMPTFGEAIAILDSIPPKELGKLTRSNVVHDSVVNSSDELSRSGGFICGRPSYRVHDSLKTYFLLYLQGRLSVEDEKSMIHLIGAYEFENLGRICLSALKVCENVDGIESRVV